MDRDARLEAQFQDGDDPRERDFDAKKPAATAEPANSVPPSTPDRTSPPRQTIVFLVLALAVYGLLQIGVLGSDIPGALHGPWVVWCVVTAAGLTLWFGVAIMGLKQLRDLTGREATFIGNRHKIRPYILEAVLFVSLICLFLFFCARLTDRYWSIAGMEARLVLVTLCMCGAAVPWVALAWALHQVIRDDPINDNLSWLEKLWDQLSNCIFAFVTVVILAVLQAGALRLLWVAQPNLDGAQKDQFSTTDVVLFGGFLAMLMAFLAIPLVVAWQQRAREFVARECKSETVPADEETWTKRVRLEALLHLDTGMFGSPLAAISVLTPLVTAALAAFVPEIGSG